MTPDTPQRSAVAWACALGAGLLLCAVWGCGADDDAPDAGVDGAVRDAPAIDGGAETVARLVAPAYVRVDEAVVLDASGSVGESFAWNLGDGRTLPESGAHRTTVSWPSAGRQQVVVSVRGPTGVRTAGALVTVIGATPHTPAQSSSIVVEGDAVYSVNADADLLHVIELGDPVRSGGTHATCDGPRTVATNATQLAVACPASDTVRIFDLDSFASSDVSLPRGSRPYGVVARGASFFVSLQGTGEVAEIADGTLRRTFAAIPDARGIAVAPDGRLAVSRWRSRDDAAEVVFLDPETPVPEPSVATLRFDPQVSNDSESGGIPSYLEQVLFSPTGQEVALPSTQANIGEGTFRSERPLTFETTVRAIVSWLEPNGAVSSGFEEDFAARKLFDNRGLAGAGIYNAFGDYLFVAMRGQRAIERIDLFGRTSAGTILGTCTAPEGLVLVGDTLFVHCPVDRVVELYDVSDFRMAPRPFERFRTVEDEPLAPEVLRGKQLFQDSADPRLARDGYIACAHCHLDGDSDHRVWDFTDRGEGLRRTPPLFGLTPGAPLHWSGNFDELQDFEGDIRNAFGGRGLMDESDWTATSDPLGAPKAGRSADLDALAAYVASLDQRPRSPHRAPGGGFTAAAERGRALFESRGCPDCHSGETTSDSRFEAPGSPLLHDVGTLGLGSGGRLGGPLPGIDTPSLHGVFDQPRLLHDGSATLMEVLTTRNATDLHGRTSDLSPAELEDLESFLRSLDGT